MLTRDRNEVKVCDFGLARHVSEEDPSLAETITAVRATTLGTPAYMPPEVILEEPVDLRADIFSLAWFFTKCWRAATLFQTAV